MELPVAAVLAMALAQSPARSFHQDFRGAQFRATVLRYYGPDSQRYVRLDGNGLRFALQGANKPLPSVGIATVLAVDGDFEITVSYEGFHATKPMTGYGAGVRLHVIADTAASDHATIARALHPGVGDVYSTDCGSYGPDGKDLHNGKRYPTSDRAGRLRLSRHGAELSYAVADDGAEEFKELRRERFVADPLKVVRIVADTGGGIGELNTVVSDFRIVCGELTAGPSQRGPSSGSPWWMVGGVVLAGVLLLGVRRRRRQRAEG